MLTKQQRKCIEFLASKETGVSSESIAFEFLGVERSRIDAPYDPSDFKRCTLLLCEVPDARHAIKRLAEKNKRWKIAHEHWEEITRCLFAECKSGDGSWLSQYKSAPKTYALMKKVGL